MADVTQSDIYNLMLAVKDTRHDVIESVDSDADQIRDRIYDVSRDTSDLRAQVLQLGITVKDNAQIGALLTEKAVLQNTVELQKQSTYLSDKIDSDGEKTRDLINSLKTQDLNRMLIERNAEVVAGRHYRHGYEQNQWASLQSQIQAFGSQLGQAQASMVNFGTQLGVGQRATSNNVG